MFGSGQLSYQYRALVLLPEENKYLDFLTLI